MRLISGSGWLGRRVYARRSVAISQSVIQGVYRRADYRCEICRKWIGTNAPSWRGQIHHCLIRRSRKHKEYDHEYNLQLLCPYCHSGKGNSRANKVNHYKRVCEVYGREKVEAWIDSLDLRTREYWD